MTQFFLLFSLFFSLDLSVGSSWRPLHHLLSMTFILLCSPGNRACIFLSCSSAQVISNRQWGGGGVCFCSFLLSVSELRKSSSPAATELCCRLCFSALSVCQALRGAGFLTFSAAVIWVNPQPGAVLWAVQLSLLTREQEHLPQCL